MKRDETKTQTIPESFSEGENADANSESRFTESSVHGIAQIFSTSGKQRVFWILLFAAALGASMFYIYQILEIFAEGKIGIAEDQTTHTELRLPDMKICPPTRLDPRKVRDMFSAEEAPQVSTYLNTLFPAEDIMAHLHPEKVVEFVTNHQSDSPILSVQNVLDENQWSVKELFRNLSYQCEDVIPHCHFGTSNLKELQCCAEPPVSPDGYCFYVKGAVQASLIYLAVMSMEIHLPKDSETEPLPEPGISQTNGIKISMVGSQDDDELYIPGGHLAHLYLQKWAYSSLKNCSRLPNADFKTCKRECLLKKGAYHSQNVVVHNRPISCVPKCTPLPDSFTGGTNICTPQQLSFCYAIPGQNVTSGAKCEEECRSKIPCNRTGVDIALSLIKLVDRPENTFLPPSTTKHPSLVVTIGYKSLDVLQRTEYEVMPREQLLSNLGGILGLWTRHISCRSSLYQPRIMQIGASIIGIIQLFVLTVTSCC